jgi:hypothetical protein
VKIIDDLTKLVALFGFIICLMFAVAASMDFMMQPTDTYTYVGIVKSVKVDDTHVTVVLDTEIVAFRLMRDQILQPPLEIGCKYQIDVNEYGHLGYSSLRSITKLSLGDN